MISLGHDMIWFDLIWFLNQEVIHGIVVCFSLYFNYFKGILFIVGVIDPSWGQVVDVEWIGFIVKVEVELFELPLIYKDSLI